MRERLVQLLRWMLRLVPEPDDDSVVVSTKDTRVRPNWLALVPVTAIVGLAGCSAAFRPTAVLRIGVTALAIVVVVTVFLERQFSNVARGVAVGSAVLLVTTVYVATETTYIRSVLDPQKVRPRVSAELDLTGRTVLETQVQPSDLRNLKLVGAKLDGLELRGRILTGVSAEGASFRNADLRGASLRQADLSAGIFVGACLRGAHLEGAYLQGADFTGADVTGATYLADIPRQVIGWPTKSTQAKGCK